MKRESFLLLIINIEVFILSGIECDKINTTIFNLSLIPNKTPPPGVYYITGGLPSYIGEFPFMAALGWTSEAGELTFHGAGMVISPKMILTAAHCVYKNGKLPDTVFIGGNNLTEASTDSLSVFSKYSVANVTIFPQYSSSLAYDDIAILELEQPTWFPAICLWNCDQLSTDNVTAIGYGLTEFAGMGSQQLLKVNLTVFPSDYCAPFFKRQRKFKMGLSEAHICAGDRDGVKDTCQGDSGGPLVVYHKDRMIAVGITSSGQACSGFPPAIYTKIQSYIKWITEVLEERGQSLQKCDCDE